jgi:hypothetical protein
MRFSLITTFGILLFSTVIYADRYEVKVHEASKACWRIAGQTYPTVLLATVVQIADDDTRIIIPINEAVQYLRNKFGVVSTSSSAGWPSQSMETITQCIWQPQNLTEVSCTLAHRAGDLSNVPENWTTANISYHLVNQDDPDEIITANECMQSTTFPDSSGGG